MQGLILGLVTMKQQERIDKQRQVRGHRDIEGAVRVQHARLNTEVLRQVQLHVLSIHGSARSCRLQHATWRPGHSWRALLVPRERAPHGQE